MVGNVATGWTGWTGCTGSAIKESPTGCVRAGAIRVIRKFVDQGMVKQRPEFGSLSPVARKFARLLPVPVRKLRASSRGCEGKSGKTVLRETSSLRCIRNRMRNEKRKSRTIYVRIVRLGERMQCKSSVLATAKEPCRPKTFLQLYV